MAKTQRWRRKRSAGEDTAPQGAVPAGSTLEAERDAAPEAEVDDVATPEPEVVDDAAPERLAEATPDTEPEASTEAAPEASTGVDDEVVDTEVDVDDDTEVEVETAVEVESAVEVETAVEVESAVEVETAGAVETADAEERADEDAAQPSPPSASRSGLGGWLLGGRPASELVPLQLLQAAHAKQALTTALAMGLIAAAAGRPAREAGVVLLTVLVGQSILGWHNDIVDRQRDAAHSASGKPIAAGRLHPDTVWYSIVVATLLLVPLAITTGIRAGCLYLAAVAIGMLGNVVGRTGFFSWWSWAASYALLPAYLSYGGWGGQAVGSAPETPIVVLAALLGVGVHFMRSVWGLVADHEDGWTYLPLKLGLKLGATRLLALSTLFTTVVAVALVVVGAQVGLSR
ncbi:UbiA family prenyltransferase [Nocardioides sp. zg-ZUI104]|uniref:UbiA family prenyltransferase n=1 Tax=Nocardioides faecalis TaxID=2803858 RepID=UPI001BCE4C27|nr:UbiA family prenyltransferase [Nocardioides faecalis]MBS4753381.1 UbiA family prenyltransferase [Nocardioides faecalis]